MRKLIGVLAALLLVGVLVPTSADARPRVVTLKLKRGTVEQYDKVRLVGHVQGARPGTRVQVQDRFDKYQHWGRTGWATVRANGTFRFKTRIDVLAPRFFRACRGTGPFKQCSKTVRLQVVKSDGDVVVKTWSGESVPGNPFEPYAPSPVTVSGTADARVLARRDPYGYYTPLVLQQLMSTGQWQQIGQGEVSKGGNWTINANLVPAGETTQLRIATVDSQTTRPSRTKPFTTKSWKNFSPDEFATVSGSFLKAVITEPATYPWWSQLTQTIFTPVGGSATLNLGNYCRTLYSRVGLMPGGASTDQMTARVYADDAELFAVTAVALPEGSFNKQPVYVSDVKNTELLRYTYVPLPGPGATQSPVWFDGYVTCLFP